MELVTCFILGLLVQYQGVHAALEEVRSKASRSAGGVDVRVPVEAEAVVTDLVHEEVGLEVESPATQFVRLRPGASGEEGRCLVGGEEER